MTPEKGKDDRGGTIHYSRFNSPLLTELIEMAREVRENPIQNDIVFEPDIDTEPEDISNWKKDKDDKDKE